MAAEIHQVREYAEMKEYYAYVREGDEITLLRCWGGESLSLPDTIDGLPVTRLADHIFAAEPSRRYKGREVYFAGGEGVFEETAAGRSGSSNGAVTGEDGVYGRPGAEKGGSAAADRVKEIRLPRFVREIGSYAFYGCRCLKYLELPETLERLGRGIFTACGHLEEIRFVYSGEEPPVFPCLREILGEIEEEVLISCICMEKDCRFALRDVDHPRRVGGSRRNGSFGLGGERDHSFAPESGSSGSLEYVGEKDYSPGLPGSSLSSSMCCGSIEAENAREGFRLLFPGYIEESIENTPARIIEVKFEGMGYQYRQCFRNGEIDFARYDSLFYLASVQEKPSTAVRLALGRLSVPCRLDAASAAAYLRFLKEHPADCADYVLGNPRERIELLLTLRRWDYFDRDLLDYWSERCVNAKDPQAVSLLADVRREKFPAKKKEYNF